MTMCVTLVRQVHDVIVHYNKCRFMKMLLLIVMYCSCVFTDPVVDKSSTDVSKRWALTGVQV